MKDYTIAETFLLPSRGKIYDSKVSAEVKLRSMTTEEEQKRLAIASYPYRVLCEIIDDCILEDIGISSYDMALGDYQFLLYKLRTVTYGEDYKMATTCPYCGCTTEEVVNLDALPVIERANEINKYLTFTLPKSKKRVKIGLQTPRSLDQISEQTKDFKKRGGTRDNSLVYTLLSLIREIDGEEPNPLHLEEWVSKLPMADVNTIITHAEKVNELLGVDTRLIITCDVCGLSHNTSLKTTQEFFRPALNI